MSESHTPPKSAQKHAEEVWALLPPAARKNLSKKSFLQSVKEKFLEAKQQQRRMMEDQMRMAANFAENRRGDEALRFFPEASSHMSLAGEQ